MHSIPQKAMLSQHEAHDCLRRALGIGRKIGHGKLETVAVIALVKKFRERALAEGPLGSISAFSNVDLEFGVSDPIEVGIALDRVVAAIPTDTGVYSIVALWKLNAKAYHLAKSEDDKNRCLCAAAEALVAQAEAPYITAFQASHLLSSAIVQIHGIPDKKNRRKELRHKLVEVQARVPVT